MGRDVERRPAEGATIGQQVPQQLAAAKYAHQERRS
jgi:hypothetical protein